MKTGIVILNYNSADETVHCIQSIEHHNSADIRYFIVDNGSVNRQETDFLDSFLQSTFADRYIRADRSEDRPSGTIRAVFVASKTNDGYAAGNNKGLRIAFSDPEIEYILILNNDVYFDSDLIPTLASRIGRLNNPGILTPVLYNLNGGIEMNCARRFPSNWEVMLPFILFKKDLFHILSRSSGAQKILKSHPEKLQEPAFVIGMPSGACMFTKKSLLQEMGGLDEETFLYYEENILCKKLQEKGRLNYCIPAAHALHAGGASTLKSGNLFLQKCSLDSADHYLKNYAGLRLVQRFVWHLTKCAWHAKFRIKARRKSEGH